MKSFRFSEETLLYAAHAEVVEEIRGRFETDLRGFFDQVADRLSKCEWPGEFTYLVNGGSAYFWISRESKRDAASEPIAWCAWRDAGIVRDHGVMLGITWAKGSSEQRARVAALADHAALGPISTKMKPAMWTLFNVWISWMPGGDPVSEAAAAFAPLLRLLDGAR